jgi:hypothetical protein
MLVPSGPTNFLGPTAIPVHLPPPPAFSSPSDYLDQDNANYLARLIEHRWAYGKEFWRPLHARQDLWMNMYLLLDLMQQAKPLGFRRYISNDPQTAIDAAVSILTRNDLYWQIDMPENLTKEERSKIGDIERALTGIVDDFDELFITTGQMRWSKQIAWMGLVRGRISAKYHVTKAALDFGRPSPLLAEIYDPRFDYPCYDGVGLAYTVIEKHTTFAELYNQYEEQITEYVEPRVMDGIDPNKPFTKLEYWSNDRGRRPGVTGVLAIEGMAEVPYIPVSTPSNNAVQGMRLNTWLIPPYRHGYSPEQLPYVSNAVNGIPIKQKPMIGSIIEERLGQRADRMGLRQPEWHGPSGWVAESGRSILAHVEELVPQYNELIATIFQHFSMGTYPTWAFKTSTGELPNFQEGMNAKIPLRLEESVQRLDPAPISQDAYRLLDLLEQERQKGILSNILQAVVPAGGNGIFWQQIANAALNALEPFQDGMEVHGTLMSSHVLNQLQAAKGIPKFQLVGRSSRSYFRLDFDPATALEDRRYKPVPVFNPALPDDFSIRAQTARILLDPRRPVMSLRTVLEKVLKVDDVEGEYNLIFEDMANLDPVIILQRIQDALRKMGEDELADRIGDQQFAAAFAQDLKTRQLQAAAAGAGGGGGAGGLDSTTGATTATGGGAAGREGQGQPGGAGSTAGQGAVGAAGVTGLTQSA